MAIPEYPISRIEHYLARANGQNVTPPDPISRIEHYLAGIAGGVDELKSQLSAVKSNIVAINDELYTMEAISPNNVSNGWKLVGNGLCALDNTCKMCKYRVTAGTLLHLTLTKYKDNVYQWQNAASVPTSGTNANLIGTPYTESVFGFVEVPEGATYLIVGSERSNESNVVSLVTEERLKKIEELEAKVDTFKDLVMPDETVCELANGTIQNTGNTRAVYTSTFAEVTACGYAELKTSRPVSSGGYYKYGWVIYDQNKSIIESVQIIDGNATGLVTIPSGGAFIRYSIYEYDSNDQVIPLRITDFTNHPTVINSYADTYLPERVNVLSSEVDALNTGGSHLYKYAGSKIDREYGIDFYQYPWAMPSPSVGGASALQGIAIYNGVVFQFLPTNKCVSFTLDNPTSHTLFDATCGHANAASFSNVKYDESDIYPLCYVSDWNANEDNKVYCLRLTDSTATLVKTYVFPVADAGHYAAACIDKDRQIMYLTGYTKPSASVNIDGENYLVLSAWDMTNETDNGDNTYSYAKLFTVTIPIFATTMQDRCFKFGKVFVLSSPSGSPTTIYAIDPHMQKITSVLYDFPSAFTTQEVEGMEFVGDRMFLSYYGNPWSLSF